MKFPGTHKSLIALSLLVGIALACRESAISPVFYGSLKGVVTYEQTGDPVKGAAISTVPTSNTVYSDSLGRYEMDSVPVGYYALVATLDGFKTASAPATVAQGTASKIDLILIPQVADPNEPLVPFPANGADSVTRNVTLTWSVKNKIQDALTFDIVLYEGNGNTPFAQYINQTDTTLALTDLRFDTQYYWQVTVKNSVGTVKNSALWNFRITPFPANRFLFSSNRNGANAVFSSDSSGSDLIQLTLSSVENVFPRFTHDRNTVAYAALVNLDYQIMLMDHKGENSTQLTALPIAGNYNQGGGFCWSPDDGQILYTHFDKLYTIDRAGGNLTAIATAPSGRHFRRCDWSAFNASIVAETVGTQPYDNEIVLVNPANGAVTTLIGNLPGTVQSPSFSIDGQKILYTRDISGFESTDGRQLDSHVFIYDISSGTSTEVSGNKDAGTNDFNPRFSPTGAQIIVENKANDNSGDSSIWIIDLTSAKRKQVFKKASMPDWR